MWLFGLMAGVPGAVIGGLAWMAILALFGVVAPAWMLGFAPVLLLVSAWKTLNSSHGSGAIGLGILVLCGTIGAAIGFLITAVCTLTYNLSGILSA